MYQVLIKRPHSFFAVVRKAKIYVDNVLVDEIKDNEEKLINVAPGEHIIKVGYGTFSGMSNNLLLNIVDNNTSIVFTANIRLYYLILTISFILGLLVYFGIITSNFAMLCIAILLLIPVQIIQTKRLLKIIKE